jgi:hypothetical protein
MSYIPASDSQYILNASGTTINPATDETILLLRRMVQLLTPIATQDVQQRQRVVVESLSNGAINTVTNVGNLQSYSNIPSYFPIIDQARNTFANGIRQNLNFS